MICNNCIRKKGFTLLEVMVAIAVFTFIVTAAAGTFVSMQQAWRVQKTSVNLVQNARWAMEFMANELRQGGAPIAITGGVNTRLSFRPYPGAPSPLVWYWRGNGGAFGTNSIIYRGVGNTIAAANLNRQELVNFIVTNPSGNLIFIAAGGGLYTIELTVRPRPTQPIGRDNRNYSVRTQVRPRN